MRAGDRLKTSMINEFNYCDFFRSLLETGKDLIFLDIFKCFDFVVLFVVPTGKKVS